MTINDFEERTDICAENFQKECHKLTEWVMAKNKDVSHQDATNIWVYKKLAEFEIRLRELESK